MAPFRTRRSFPPRTSDDGAWVHDKAPGAAAVVVPTAPAAGVNNKLVVSNLHYEVTQKDLSAIFGQIGTLIREPLIRYDRSGRSSGVAIITFETPAEATRAKNQFNGVLAKGQPIEIDYDNEPPRHHRRSAGAPSSLINRIQKAPLIERLGRAESQAKQSLAKTARGGAGTRARGRGRGSAIGVRQKPQAKTAAELDKELDAFMGDGPGSNDGGGASKEAQSVPAASADNDVEMA
ncbi:hypothetical protein EW146_g1862 [Bondarzewia mesenterica]|uniref:RRM domain-containing protein n=1 Tax=Bondarzewia mesenterica TaxID=1095465 RepID=A0A4S4M8R0_9AGAM|nr:hypothetical protein EW146_g1862 [Bondarzewia mesenterica]